MKVWLPNNANKLGERHQARALNGWCASQPHNLILTSGSQETVEELGVQTGPSPHLLTCAGVGISHAKGSVGSLQISKSEPGQALKRRLRCSGTLSSLFTSEFFEFYPRLLLYTKDYLQVTGLSFHMQIKIMVPGHENTMISSLPGLESLEQSPSCPQNSRLWSIL